MKFDPGDAAPTMLTNAESILHYDDQAWRVIPDRLTQRSHATYLPLADAMLRIYAAGIHQPRRELHRQIERLCSDLDDCPPRRVAAFCKLLDDASEYDIDKSSKAAKLRQQVFALAAPLHPLVTKAEGLFANTESEVKQRIAQQLGTTWEAIDHCLFADIIEFQRLRSFTGYADGAALLARYNVAQTQTALYRALHLVVWSRSDHKMILRYAKLARLMHSIARQDNGVYCFRFDGPASVLRRSTRYGVAMARFLPGLLACGDWKAIAKVRGRHERQYRLELSSKDGLRTNVAAADAFDSDLEAEFFEAWGAEERDGWRLERESELLHQGQTVLTPDFTLVHADGRRVLLEIVGYWTPEYLTSKAATLERFRDQPLLIALPEQTKMELPSRLPPPIVFKRTLRPDDVLRRLASLT